MILYKTRQNKEQDPNNYFKQSYREIREGKNLKDDKDLASYLHAVFRIRSKLEIDR